MITTIVYCVVYTASKRYTVYVHYIRAFYKQAKRALKLCSSTIAYTNQSMARLPDTGGPGRTLYTWAGIMLCMLSVLLYKLLQRRRGDEHLT